MDVGPVRNDAKAKVNIYFKSKVICLPLFLVTNKVLKNLSVSVTPMPSLKVSSAYYKNTLKC